MPDLPEHRRQLQIELSSFRRTERMLSSELQKPLADRDCAAVAWWIDGLSQTAGSIRAHARYVEKDQGISQSLRDDLRSVESIMRRLPEKAKSCIKAI